MHNFVSSLSDLAGSVLSYQAAMADLDSYDDKVIDDAKQALSRARAWVAFPDGEGGWAVGFAKFVGYDGLDLIQYAKYRKTKDKTRLDGSEADRRIRTIAASAGCTATYPVGNMVGVSLTSKAVKGGGNHPAAKAVRAFVESHGKKVNSLAEVLVIDRDLNSIFEDSEWGVLVNEANDDPILDVLVAAIKAADLSEGALENLFSRVRA